jgi:hypothetical protein
MSDADISWEDWDNEYWCDFFDDYYHKCSEDCDSEFHCKNRNILIFVADLVIDACQEASKYSLFKDWPEDDYWRIYRRTFTAIWQLGLMSDIPFDRLHIWIDFYRTCPEKEFVIANAVRLARSMFEIEPLFTGWFPVFG